MNRSTTLDIKVLQAASKATNDRHCQLMVVKLATNANAGGASITTTNVNSQNSSPVGDLRDNHSEQQKARIATAPTPTEIAPTN